ncbi:diguanylate cyclase [Niveibacterium sp. COAC-50]|uniref:tetratricopeptide repeat-containing diguanylate cyclase n=1 Tax=Niveibacterium sp. COAC-50 TaxID=2729384 RepID=UPI0015582634
MTPAASSNSTHRWADLQTQFERVWGLLLREPQEAHDLALGLERAGRMAGDPHSLLLAELLLLTIRARMAHDPQAVVVEAQRIRGQLAAQGDLRNALRCVVTEANALADLERRADALALIRESLPAARELLDAADLGRLLNSCGAIEVDEGRHVEAVTAWYEALELLNGVPPTAVLAMVMLNVGVMYVRFGNFAAAEPHLRDALSLVEEQSLLGMTNICAGNLAYNLIQLGRADEASRFMEALAPRVERDYDLREYAFFQIVRAEAKSAIGQLDGARACLTEVAELGASALDLQNVLYLRIADMRLLRREERLDEARNALLQAEADPMHIDDPIYELQLLLEASEIMHCCGDDRSAFRYARQHHMYSIEMDREFQRADFISLHTRYEVRKTIVDRDFEVRRREEAERARLEIEALNAALAARVQEIERLQGELREQAIRDPLTGVYNRRFLQELLPTEIARCVREGRPLSLCLVDADHFKQINDQLGHGHGDMVLCALAAALSTLAVDGLVVARFGGEEFCVVLPDCDALAAARLVDGLRLAFSARSPLPQLGSELRVSFSGGVAALSDWIHQHPRAVECWIAAADEALYSAKQSGRNRIAIAAERLRCD